MFKKKQQKIQPNPSLFKNKQVGRTPYKPLIKKDGTPYDTVDYFELLGRRAIDLDNQNKNKSLPTNYGEGFDRDVVAVSKEVVKALDNGMSKDEIMQYLNTCIVLDK